MSKFCRGSIRSNRSCLIVPVILVTLVGVAESVLAGAQTLRVVAYNIDADTSPTIGAMGGPISGPGIETVLQAIGNATLGGNAQPIDVLALEELAAAPFRTLDNAAMNGVVNKLNAIYGAGTYTWEQTIVDPNTGGTGGGPSGLVWNTHTVQLLGVKAVGNASSTGAPRAPMRYTLAPVGLNDHSADFTVYVSHTKAGTDTSTSPTDYDRRNTEATTLRNDAAALDATSMTTYGKHAHVIYSGDFNLHSNTEAAYQTMISPSLNGGVAQAIDSVNRTNDWTTAGTFHSLFTESATSVSSRFDFQFITAPMDAGQAGAEPGMQIVPGTYIPFGNGGAINHQSVTNSANTAAFPDLGVAPYSPSYRTSVLNALTTTTDHLPLVADYSFATAVGIPGDYDRSGLVDAADYNLWQTSFDSTTSLAADGNGDGVVDAADYTIWQDNLGHSVVIGPGAGSLSNTAVPEPSAAILLILGGYLILQCGGQPLESGKSPCT
jgi:hypothetical protein